MTDLQKVVETLFARKKNGAGCLLPQCETFFDRRCSCAVIAIDHTFLVDAANRPDYRQEVSVILQELGRRGTDRWGGIFQKRSGGRSARSRRSVARQRRAVV